MRSLVAMVLVAMLATSVLATGGVNESTRLEETGIDVVETTDMAYENQDFEILLTLEEDTDITSIVWVTQVCINTGVCYAPISNDMTDSGDGLTFTGSIPVDDYATYVNWNFVLTHADESENNVPETGFGWKIWSDCWYDNENWGGPSSDCRDDLPPSDDADDDDDLLPGFAAPLATLALAMAALIARRD